MQTHYELLGLDRLASVEEIREVLVREERRLSLLLDHPDEERRAEARKRVVLLASVEQTLLEPAARAQYDEQIARQPKRAAEGLQPAGQSPQQLTAHARLLLEMGQPEDALVFAKVAASLDDNSADAWVVIAAANEERGDAEAAIAAYRRAIALRPDDDDLHFSLGLMLAEQGHHDQAIDQFQQADAISAHAVHKTAIGHSLIALGRIDEGLALIESAAAEHPDDPAYQSRLARAYQQVAFMPWVDGPEEGDNTKYAVSYEQASFARTMIDKALALSFNDEALRASLREDQTLVAANFKRQYLGAKVQPVLAFAFGSYILVSGGRSDVAPSLWLALGSVLYVVSCFLPAYVTNKEYVLGRKRYDDFGWAHKLRSMLPDNMVGVIVGLMLAVVVLLMIPVFGIYNLYRFHWDSILRWVNAQRDGSGAFASLAQDVQRGYGQIRSKAKQATQPATQDVRSNTFAEPANGIGGPAPAAASTRVADRGPTAAAAARVAGATAQFTTPEMQAKAVAVGKQYLWRAVKAKAIAFGAFVGLIVVALILWMSLGSSKRSDAPIKNVATGSQGQAPRVKDLPARRSMPTNAAAARPVVELAAQTATAGSSAALGPGFAKDERNGCSVYKPGVLGPNESVQWLGACEGGLADGVGQAMWFIDGKDNIRYTGTFRRGRLEGEGSMGTVQGDDYLGFYHLGMREGRGVYTSSTGAKYEGDFLQNKRHGRGVLTLADGTRQEGRFLDGKFAGP